MKLLLAFIDFKTATIEIREKFSIAQKNLGYLAKNIKEVNQLNGCVLISTCNRTEIYVSSDSYIDVQQILCEAIGIAHIHTDSFVYMEDDEAITHLMRVASGLESQVFAEDQIISQVKTALSAAQEAEACDSILQTFFRISIAAAKNVKTSVRMSAVLPSVAYSAVEVLKKEIGDISYMKALVIGNGEIGKLAARLLFEEGVKTTVTVREYKKGNIEIPVGCDSIPYGHRYEYLKECDLCLSATASPHHTITKSEIEKYKYPNFFVDLAVPRDIEPEVSNLGVRVLNIDDLGISNTDEKSVLLAYDILEKYKEKFYKWYDYKIKHS